MKAHYHQPGKAPLELHVVKDHKNGTLDLGRDASGPAIITDCPVSKDGAPGTCTLIEADAKAAKAETDAKAKAEAEAKAKAEALRVKATELAAAAIDARKTADDAKGQPGVAALREAAEAAEAAAKQADTEADAAEAALKD